MRRVKRDTNLYEILGVSPTSEDVVIEAAYRALMRRYHGKAASDPELGAKVQKINAAYSTLSNARKRGLYDAGLQSRAASEKSAQVEARPLTSADQAPAPDQTRAKPPQAKPIIPTASPPNKQPMVSGRPSQDVPGPKDKTNFWPFVIAGLVFIVAVRGCDGQSDPAATSTQTVASSAPAEPSLGTALNEQSNVVAEAPPPPLVFDEFVAFENPANCVAAPSLDQAFKNMLPVSTTTGRPETPRSVQLGDVQITPKVNDLVTAEDPPDTISTESSVRLPRGVWHDLPVSRLIVRYYSPPETDSSYSRAITFRAPVEEVRAVLAKLGFNPPSPGSYSTLTDDACGGSMQIVPVAGGSELRCSWGC